MKKFLISILVAVTLASASRADEGMWLLPLLEKINAETMRNLGSRLTPEQIYSVNNSSIKDAIVQFGGGCTGEIISSNGLLVTNHHCGYGSIQALSTEEHNYLEDGFWAMSLNEELPVPGLSVKFLVSMTEVTGKAEDEEARKSLVEKAEKENPNCMAQIVSFYNDNVQYLIVYKIYRDVRFVGAPPVSVGKFGGETDNWTWPRQTGDFSMFRVYAGEDNEPAAYSPDNVPMKPRQHLSISLKGVQEGNFAMIMGYPGSTQRYQTSFQLEEMLKLNDIRIDARTVTRDIIWDEMRADEGINLKYASKFAGLSNGRKKWIGMREAFAKLDVIERQKTKEQELSVWISAKKSRVKKYGDFLSQIESAIAERERNNMASTLLRETLLSIDLFNIASRASDNAYSRYDAEVDRKLAHALLKHYQSRVEEQDVFPLDSAELERIFRESAYTSLEKLDSARAAGVNLSEDPARLLADELRNKYMQFNTGSREIQDSLRAASKLYAAALMEWNSDTPSYPDANMTCCLTYGTVGGYGPRDGVVYKYYTTLKGVMEKENPEDYEFRVPARLKEIYDTQDYGDYANAEGELVTCFLANLDITGGNSGSPVLDADGNLIGLAFDGNWEAMSGDVIFEPELQRCICVDIRYVLLMVDKFGGAGYLLDEMDIVK